MRIDIKKSLDSALSDVDWHGENEVLSRIRPKARAPRLRLAFVACLLVLAIGGTALAVGLHWTERYSDIRRAREAVAAKYGLTSDMLDLFYEKVSEDGQSVVLSYMAGDDHGRAGYYTFNTADGSVVWSHDGAEIDESGALDAAVWGKAQLQTRFEHGGADMDDRFNTERLVNNADQSAGYRSARPAIEETDVSNLPESPLDWTRHNAIQAARKALIDQRGFNDYAFTLFDVRTTQGIGADGAVWTVCFSSATERMSDTFALDAWMRGKLGDYTVTFDRDGNAACAWSKEGVDENTYTRSTFGAAKAFSSDMFGWIKEVTDATDAIEAKYMSYSPLTTEDMSVSDAAAYAHIMQDAGVPAYADPLYPEDVKLTDQQALEIASQLLKDEYGCTDEAIAAAGIRMWLIRRGDERLFRMQIFIAQADWFDDFHIDVDADTGAIDDFWHDTPVSGGVG